MDEASQASAKSFPQTNPVISRRAFGQWLSSGASAVALVASGVSLWETVLKQPNLKVYVGQTILYTQDPRGSYEVFAVPVTIMNSGAQDGVVVALRLELANAASGDKELFDAAYTADSAWFSGSDNILNNTRRAKSPFSALSIAGRSAWTGTVLFYTPENREKRITVAQPKSQISGILTIASPKSDGWLDRLFATSPEPIFMSLGVPNYLPGALLSGEVARLRVSFGAQTAAPVQAAAPVPVTPTPAQITPTPVTPTPPAK